MYDEDRNNYAVVGFNTKTKEREILMVVRGRSKADAWAIRCEAKLSAAERDEGWTHYTEKTTLPVNDSTG